MMMTVMVAAMERKKSTVMVTAAADAVPLRSPCGSSEQQDGRGCDDENVGEKNKLMIEVRHCTCILNYGTNCTT